MTVGEATRRPRDLDTRGQIHDLVIQFYREIMLDPLLGPVFDEVAEVDWSAHIPTLIDFWCRVLLGQPGYGGFILSAHQRVHDIERFEPEMFDRWYVLFVEAVDGAWQGPIADAAKVHAQRMATVLCRRLLGVEWQVPCALVDVEAEPISCRA
jgi:hemoglobin